MVFPGIVISILFCPYVVPFIYCDICPVYFCPMKTLRIPFLIVSFAYVIVSRKSFCTVCPAGTAQDIIVIPNKYFIKKYIKLNPTNRAILRIIRYIVLIIALGIVLILNNPRYMIPYHTFSLYGLFYESNIYYSIKILFVVMVVIIAVFMPRFWCKLCPFGALLSILSSLIKKCIAKWEHFKTRNL